MINRIRFVYLLVLLVCVGLMTYVWAKYVPHDHFETFVWWAVEVVLGFFGFKALVALIIAGGVKKQFDEFPNLKF